MSVHEHEATLAIVCMLPPPTQADATALKNKAGRASRHTCHVIGLTLLQKRKGGDRADPALPSGFEWLFLPLARIPAQDARAAAG